MLCFYDLQLYNAQELWKKIDVLPLLEYISKTYNLTYKIKSDNYNGFENYLIQIIGKKDIIIEMLFDIKHITKNQKISINKNGIITIE